MDVNLLPPEFRSNNGTEIKEFTYQNTGYKNTRLSKRILNIDSGQLNSNQTTFSLELQEKFRIDKKSDIYLDSITTYNCKSNADTNSIGFLLTIDEFNNNNSFSNTSGIHNKIFIPNDSTNTTATATTVTHKGKKLNYVGTINPTELMKLNLTLTILDSTTTIFNSGNSRFLMELIFVENE